MSIEDNIRKVTPYTPGEQPKDTDSRVIKLNTNECPYPPSPKVAEAIKNMDTDRLRLYPEIKCETLTNALGSYYGFDTEQVFAGVGSDDVLSMCFLSFFAGKKPVLFPDITYSFYDVWADVYRIPYVMKPLDENFSITAADYYGENGGVVIANPNAPTGVVQSVDFIEDIVRHNQDSVVLVDEAYIDFGGQTALPLVNKYDNVIVTRTMSKSRALAGMRIGYAIGPAGLIKYLNDVKYSVNSYTMNMPALAAGKAAIEDDAYFREITGKVIATREWTGRELCKLGFTFNQSGSNFIFAKPPEGIEASYIFAELRRKNIFVRYFNKPRISGHLRISIGTDEEMEILISTLKGIMNVN